MKIPPTLCAARPWPWPARIGARQLGFTLIELIMMIVMIVMLGVLAVFAAPRMLDFNTWRLRV
ncbi:hypothetical protein [Rhodoferax sp.]|uniref:hypothetical protein n=1 Tax=Rhodoferax sp. TaxID=50421 RepID=UPI00374CD75C